MIKLLSLLKTQILVANDLSGAFLALWSSEEEGAPSFNCCRISLSSGWPGAVGSMAARGHLCDLVGLRTDVCRYVLYQRHCASYSERYSN